METKMRIKSATLLSVDEAERLLSKQDREYHSWWWLRSPGFYQNYAAFVNDVGSVYYYGTSVNIGDGCVRPALNIDLDSSDLKIGDVFDFGGKKFKIISSHLAFCLDDIGEACFRKDWRAVDAENYELSDIKRFIDSWFEETTKWEKCMGYDFGDRAEKNEKRCSTCRWWECARTITTKYGCRLRLVYVRPWTRSETSADCGCRWKKY